MKKHLPIEELIPTLLRSVIDRKNIVLTAPTGSGKSTQVPQNLFQCSALKKTIVVVQPRRLACRVLAKRVAEELNCTLGNEVGYQVRYENQVSASTRLIFMTDGVLLRHLESNQSLPWADVVIFDEFHERRILMDLSLAILRRMQKRGLGPILVAMSATMNHSLVTSYLDAIHLHCKSRTHKIETSYEQANTCEEAIQLLPKWVRNFYHLKKKGDILVFLPGKREIHEAERLLKSEQLQSDLTIIPLHSELSNEEQDLAFQPSLHRKVILATNVTETSLTIPGIRFVIDTGFERRAVFDPHFRVTRLNLERISQASADQRAGRAGREGPGRCIRLWSKDTNDQLLFKTPIEIQNTDLASVVLTLKSMGVLEPETFEFLESPPQSQLASAQLFLKKIGALEENGELTPIGWRMLRLPLSPRYSRMVVESEKRGCLFEIATVAAIMCSPPLFSNHRWIPSNAYNTSDFFSLIDLYHRFRVDREDELREWCKENEVNVDAFQEATLLRKKVIGIALDRGSLFNRQPAPVDSVLRCLLAGLTDQIATRQKDGLYKLPNGMICKTRETNIQTPLIAAAEIRLTPNQCVSGIISTLTAIPPELAKELLLEQRLNSSNKSVVSAAVVPVAKPPQLSRLPPKLQEQVTRLTPTLQKLLGSGS